MCTVVTRWERGEPLRVLAIRDELLSREFDDPGAWWPAHPGVVGGRDRQAGGSWCVTDVAAGISALVLNRPERRTGRPSRGVLPLAAIASGAAWTDGVDHRDMASFTLVLAGPSGVTAWDWDTRELVRTDFGPGTHVFTGRGVDDSDDKPRRYFERFRRDDWLDVLTAERPVDDVTALLVRHEIDGDVYGSVFGQFVTSAPGTLSIRHSRTPWERAGWTEDSWS